MLAGGSNTSGASAPPRTATVRAYGSATVRFQHLWRFRAASDTNPDPHRLRLLGFQHLWRFRAASDPAHSPQRLRRLLRCSNTSGASAPPRTVQPDRLLGGRSVPTPLALPRRLGRFTRASDIRSLDVPTPLALPRRLGRAVGLMLAWDSRSSNTSGASAPPRTRMRWAGDERMFPVPTPLALPRRLGRPACWPFLVKRPRKVPTPLALPRRLGQEGE